MTSSVHTLSGGSAARKHVLLSSTVLLAALLLVVVAAGARLLIGVLHAVLAVVAGDLGLVHDRKLLRGQDVALVLEVALGEDEINLLERAAGSLRVQEVDDGEEDGIEDGEEQVGVGSDAVDEDGRNHDNEKVPEPVGDGRSSVGLRAGLDGVDLSGVQPRQRQPGSTEERDVCEQTDGSALGSRSSVGEQAAEGQDHGQALSNGTDEEELAATDALNEEPGGGGEDGVDDHVDTTKEQGQVVGGVKSVLEQNGEVVDDSVATRKLLHHLRGGTQKHAAEMLRLAVGKDSGELGLATTTGQANGFLDDVHLDLDFGVLAGKTVERSHDSRRLFLAVMGEEPARRFRQLGHHDDDNNCEDALESDGESPGEVVRAVKTSVVDPVSNQRANGDVTALNADDLSTVLSAAALGLVGGNGRCVDTVADTSDASSNDELRSSTAVGRNRSNLDNNTDDHNTGAEEDRVTATKSVSEGEDEAGTEEAADSVDSNNETLVGRVTFDLGESFDECGGGDNTRHDTLVISEQEEIGGSNNSDQDLQHPAGLAPVGGHARLCFFVRCHGED
ncbi:hypothetical protein OPT61_g4648 [Boeremia exigua]|uniref:Uncharacterized protein n=1 Tax=Boeremia exigua TaxID=749465 RepID=A0ACC2IDF1_9PLEO|nr:hypothetical protein OPT61_g4648 [Boeremia exigua]